MQRRTFLEVMSTSVVACWVIPAWGQVLSDDDGVSASPTVTSGRVEPMRRGDAGQCAGGSVFPHMLGAAPADEAW